MPQVATQVLELLLDPSTTDFAGRTSLFANAEIGLAGLFTIGPGFLLPVCLRVELVYDSFTELPGLVQQTQIRRVSNRLGYYGGVQDQLALVLRSLIGRSPPEADGGSLSS